MDKNVFMTSMYFFIPLKRISRRYKSDYGLNFNKIHDPAFTQSGEASCQYAQIVFTNSENHFHFTYQANSLKTHKTNTRHIQIKAFVLKYRSFYNSKNEMPILMIGTSIDKLFTADEQCETKQEFADRLCSIEDLVFLKRAFTSRKDCLVSDTDSSETIHSWLKKLVAKIETHNKRTSISMIHSICDVKGMNIDICQIQDKETLDQVFTEKYYNALVTSSTDIVAIPTIDQSIHGNYKAFIYGLLFGNTNYDRGNKKEIDSYIIDAYSNNISEITVAAPMTIVFLHTHHPFRTDKTKEKRQRGFCNNLADVQNIFEMCEVIYAEKRIALLRNSFREISPSTVIKTLLGLTRYMERDLFNLVEMDKKVNYIFDAIGINKQFATIKEMSDMASRSTELKVNNRLNLLMLIIAITSSVFALIQIIQNYKLNN